MRDLIPIWGHQTQWDIRQHPKLHRIWAALWGNDVLRVSLASCRFTPPWRPGYAEPYGLHWDHAPKAPGVRFLQGVLALTDTAVDQGGWRCVSTLYHALRSGRRRRSSTRTAMRRGQPTRVVARLFTCRRPLAT
jgi:hypothetical protein